MGIFLSPNDSCKPFILISGLYEETLSRALLDSAIFTNPAKHLYHLATFIQDIIATGYFPVHQIPKHARVILILLDCPSHHVLRSIYSSFKPQTTICLIAEHYLYQHSHLYATLQMCDFVIYSYDLPFNFSSPKLIRTATSFVYKEIPLINNSLSSSYDTSIFCSNIISGTPSLYSFRRHLINISSALFGGKFLHCGKGWVKNFNDSCLNSFLRDSKSVFKKVIYRPPNVSLSSYYGAPISKNILSYCKTTYAVENFLSPIGWTTEKALEPLSYGCLPIYIACSSKNWLSNFLPIYAPDSFEILASTFDFIAMDKSTINNHVGTIRDNINSYLSSHNSTSLKSLYFLLRNII